MYNRSRDKRHEWVSITHPEGKLYHRTLLQGIAFTTDTDIYNDLLFEAIESTLGILIKYYNTIESERSKDGGFPCKYYTEIVLDVFLQSDRYLICEYYVVDHKNQHILWLEGRSIPSSRRVFGGPDSTEHISKAFLQFLIGSHRLTRLTTSTGQLLLSEYFVHVSYYPHGNELSNKRLNVLKGVLSWALTGNYCCGIHLMTYLTF